MREITRRNARIWSMLGMRRIVGQQLKELAEADPQFMFATADVARYFGVEEFEKEYPDRFTDVGIAEQNLIGVAAGMQKEGLHVFAATYATFITARVLDQIRVSLGYMGLGVKLIGVGGGLAEGDLSATHMGLEDIADIRPIPHIAIICPADGVETIKALHALLDYDGPAYLRLTGRTNLPVVYTSDYEFCIGRSVCLKEGTEVVVIATGCIVGTALKAAETLETRGISCRVINMHTIRPLDEAELRHDETFKLIVTVEEHMVTGGLGSAVAEFYCDEIQRPPVYRLGVKDRYPDAREYEDILSACELDADGIASSIERRYKEIRREE